MSIIYRHADKVGHQIVGQLVRRREWDSEASEIMGEKSRLFVDDAGNEYILGKFRCLIVTVSDEII